MQDLVIRNGLVVDGTGGAPFHADVAVSGHQISFLGDVVERGTREIDARGHIVTPGFVDLHTHLDAQIGWDSMLTPSSWHGVTTVVLGNCGVTFAPCRPGEHTFLAGMMETVEDIPREAILRGLSWNWEHYGEYLDELERLDPVVDVAGMIGHCALRYYVMGERGIDEQPSDAELLQMVEIVATAIAQGAVGFSTSRNPGHQIPDGRSVPGTYAGRRELVEIAKAVGAAGGLMQSVMNMGDVENELDLLQREAQYARLLFSHYTGRTRSFGDKIEARVNAMREQGLDVSAMVIPRSSGYVMSLDSILPWQGGNWDALLARTPDERRSAIRDPAFVDSLIDHAREHEPRTEPSNVYYLGEAEKPAYVGGADCALAALAEVRDEHPAETFLRMSADSGGQALFAWRALNQSMDALAAAISSDFCLPGLGDAGAHVSQIMDAGWTTFVLTHWHRDAQILGLADAVRRLTAAPARIVGLTDRGVIQSGKKADLNVIDLGRLNERMPRIVHDLPNDAPRFVQHAEGYRATICSGKVVLENDQHTGIRAGSVVRHAGTTHS